MFVCTDAEASEYRELDEQLTESNLQVSRFLNNTLSEGATSIVDQVFVSNSPRLNVIFSGSVHMQDIFWEHTYQLLAIVFMKIEKFLDLTQKRLLIVYVQIKLAWDANSQQNGLLYMSELVLFK